MKRTLTLLASLMLLSACDQVTVSGSVGDADIVVTDLRSGEVIYEGDASYDMAAIEAEYDTAEWDDTKYLRKLGQFKLRELEIDNDRYYLVTLNGGLDYDSNETQQLDTGATSVMGPVRGVLTGAEMKLGGHNFGPLSEAAWQWVRQHYAVLDNNELAAVLDEFAASLVGDVIEDDPPNINYADLLAWNPLYFDAELYTGDVAALESLEDAIAAGASDADRLAIVNQMTGLAVPVGAADAWFREDVSPNVAQDECVACHVDGGIAGNTDHVLVPTSNPDHLALNTAMYADLIAGNDVQYVLNKASGATAHIGGSQLSVGSDDYMALETFLTLLAGENSDGPGTQDVLEGYGMASAEDTLRRASMLLAGELPTDEDLATVAGGDEQALRFMIRQLMQGDGFHQFLIEGANDRLLTDKWIEDLPVEIFFQPFYPDLVNRAAELSDAENLPELIKLVQGTSFGLARQPLELIAYVVEEELPYTEILTADYTMVNPQLAFAYRSGVVFDTDEDINQWQPATVEGYTRIDDSTVYEEAADFGAYVSGGIPTEYPHAGVLNTPGWLARYPSTDTNRNRARSRWTWYHFLGFDIERSAPRTTDPDALSDTDNPTMKNPNCTVCHEVMDPIAGAYQNYGDDGFYKDKFGGLDSLPYTYKFDREQEQPYQPGETWYNDMREPGFDGFTFANTESTLQDLALAITSDVRFAEGTVKFWWPALMGEEPVLAPGDQADQGYAEQLAMFQTQQAAIDTFASSFITGFDGGAPYNLKDLLVEMIMSPWFRIDAAGEDVSDSGYMRGVGTGKLLTPEQLDRKTMAVTGFRWYEDEYLGVTSSQLTEQYRLFYGGIDSDGVTIRATEMTSLMTTVVEAQPLQMGCVLVGIEFQWPASYRTLFTEVDRNQNEANAEAAVRAQLVRLHERFLGETLDPQHPEIDRALGLFTETRAARIENGYPARLNGSDQESCPFFVLDDFEWDLSDPTHALNSWVSMLIYYMTDYRYIYQ